MEPFRFLMISAMYENGGNTTQRFLDSHPELMVYPFESQPGTAFVHDHLSSMFPLKYRWPTFPLENTEEQDYRSIIDEEGKVRSRTPYVSKFRDADFQMNDEERKDFFVRYLKASGRSRGNAIAAFFRATFDAWKNFKRTGKESMYVGYSPIIGVDSDKILTDLPDAHVLHVVRNPWSAYADTKKRPVPLSLQRYVSIWTMVQYHALIFQAMFPDRMHILRFEDLVANPTDALSGICKRIGIATDHAFKAPTWNRHELKEVYPWGTIRIPTPDANKKTAGELSKQEQSMIQLIAQPLLQKFGYEKGVASL